MSKLIKRIVQNKSILFICDIQEKFRPLIFEYKSIIHNTIYVQKVSQILKIPCIITEQYPKAFGRTVSEILENVNQSANTTNTTTTDDNIQNNQTQIYEKRQFSMLIEEVTKQLDIHGNYIIYNRYKKINFTNNVYILYNNKLTVS